MPPADDRLYNVLLEILAATNRNSRTIEENSQDVAKWAKASYDMVPLMDNRLAYFLTELRIHKAEVRADIEERVEKALAAAAADRREMIEAIIAIRSATAVATNEASDAKSAATAASLAATAAREATGKHSTEPAGGESSHHASVFALLRDLVRGLPSWARFTLAVLLIAAAVFGGQAIEAKLHLLGERSTRAEKLEEPRKP